MTDMETNAFERRVYYLQFPGEGSWLCRVTLEAPGLIGGRRSKGEAWT